MEGSVIHYEGSASRADHVDCQAQVDAIRAYHRRLGYADIAYCWLACQHGGDFAGRGWGPNAATGDTWANLNLHAICALIGPGEEPSVALLRTLARLIDTAPDGRKAVYAHSDFTPTACPGDPLRDWVRTGAKTPSSSPIVIPGGDCMRLIQNTPESGGDGKWYLVTCNGLTEVTPLDAWNYALAGIPHGPGSGPVIVALDQAIERAKT